MAVTASQVQNRVIQQGTELADSKIFEEFIATALTYVQTLYPSATEAEKDLLVEERACYVAAAALVSAGHTVPDPYLFLKSFDQIAARVAKNVPQSTKVQTAVVRNASIKIGPVRI